MQSLWYAVKNAIYSLNEDVKSLGFKGSGVTTYFSENCTKDDAILVYEFIVEKGYNLYNTRCFKTDFNGIQYTCKYEIRLASTDTEHDPELNMLGGVFKNALFEITRGDYDLLLWPVVENLIQAKEYAANDTEVDMIRRYIEHFITGSLNEHKLGTSLWIKNKNPAVETGIGFIKGCRDLSGLRGEFRGFVAMINRDTSRKFSALVDSSETILLKLPWGKDFEKDYFS